MTRRPDDPGNPHQDVTGEFSDIEEALRRRYAMTMPDHLSDRIRAMTQYEREARASASPSTPDSNKSAVQGTTGGWTGTEATASWERPALRPRIASTLPRSAERQSTTPRIPSESRGGPARRSYGVAYGVLAGIALVLVLVLTPALWDRQDTAIELSGGRASTGIAAGSAGPESGDPGAGPVAAPRYGTTDGTAYVQVPYGDCSVVTPLGYDEAIRRILPEDGSYQLFGSPPDAQIATSRIAEDGLTQWDFTTLPEGELASQSDIAAMVEVYTLYRGCEASPLRQATQLSPEGLQRAAFRTPGPENVDTRVDEAFLAQLQLSSEAEFAGDPGLLGELSDAYLYDFRVIEEGRVVAYLSHGVTAATMPAFFDGAGYVVFVERDGEWLIDEQFIR